MCTLTSNQVVEKLDFMDMIVPLKSRANIRGRYALVTLLKGIAKGFAADISTMFRDEHVSITTNG